MKLKSLLVMLAILVAFTLISNQISNVSALTGSIGNARMILYPEVGFFGVTIDKYILVKNVNNVSVNISLQASEEIKDIVNILDENFQLEPGEEKKAQFEIDIDEAGDYDGKIHVFFKASNGTGSGVALSSNLIIYAKDGGLIGDSGEDKPIEGYVKNKTLEEGDIVIGSDSSEGSAANVKLIVLSLFTLILAIILVVLFLITKKMKDKRGYEIKLRKRVFK